MSGVLCRVHANRISTQKIDKNTHDHKDSWYQTKTLKWLNESFHLHKCVERILDEVPQRILHRKLHHVHEFLQLGNLVNLDQE